MWTIQIYLTKRSKLWRCSRLIVDIWNNCDQHTNVLDDDEEGEEGEEGEEKMPSCGDYIMHFLTLPWKLIFALIPPTGKLILYIFNDFITIISNLQSSSSSPKSSAATTKHLSELFDYFIFPCCDSAVSLSQSLHQLRSK